MTTTIQRPRSRPPFPHIDNDLTRREFLFGAGLIAVAPSCGRSENGEDGSVRTRTVEHKYGSTVISGDPKRVVTVGWIEQDAVLALGIVPLATTQWVGGYPGAIFPWARDKLGDTKIPEALDNIEGIKFESIAALAPDLVLALYSDISREEYETLSEIAPTIAQPQGYEDLGVPWQELTRTVGRALGLAGEADRLVQGVEARFDGVRERHPEFVGATALNAYPLGGGAYDAYPPPDLGGRLLEDLGFETPGGIREIADGRGTVKVSGERLDLFDTDVLVWLIDNDAQRDDVRDAPLYARLDVAAQGRDIFLSYGTDPLAEATSVQTVLSLPFLLDGLVPRLAAAIDGEPETTIPGS